MSKLKPTEKPSLPEQRSWGPCYTIVRDDGARFDQYILARYEPTEGQIRATADRTVQQYLNAYRQGFHWEPARLDTEMTGVLRGQSALAEAKRIILDEPCDSAGKRFLLGGKRLKESFVMPAVVDAPINTIATRAMLDRLDEEPAEVSGSQDFDLPMDPAEDDRWERG